MSKLALVVCFAACISAEPGYLGYGGYGINNLGASVGIAGYAPAAIPGVYGGYAGAGRYIANSAGVVHIAKREAEAEAGYLGYGGYGINNLGAFVGIAGYAPAAIPGVYGGYAGAGRYIANSAGVVHIAKREAETEAGYLGYGGYGIHNIGASVGIAGYAPAAIPGVYGGYAGAGRYIASSAGVVHIAKREAEAEAGYLGYRGYGIHNLGAHVGIAGYAPAAIPGVYGGYAGAGRYIANSAGVVHIAKRDADAEPGYLGYGGYGITNLGASVGIAGYAPAAVPGVYGGYAGAGRYIANSAGVVHIAKREADAEAGYLGYGAYGSGAYGLLGYAGLGYGHGGIIYG